MLLVVNIISFLFVRWVILKQFTAIRLSSQVLVRSHRGMSCPYQTMLLAVFHQELSRVSRILPFFAIKFDLLSVRRRALMEPRSPLEFFAKLWNGRMKTAWSLYNLYSAARRALSSMADVCFRAVTVSSRRDLGSARRTSFSSERPGSFNAELADQPEGSSGFR